jgi:hypothetical protein
MKFIHRLGYYLGGFSIGLVILAFFLRGKNTSCAYGPNARTIKNITIKKKVYSDDAITHMKTLQLDSLSISKLIQTGDVNFSESKTKSEGCKTYIIENTYEKNDISIRVENCDSVATIQSLFIKD